MSLSLRIAIADDESLILEYLNMILPELGHEVVAAAHDGRQLVDLVRSTRPDLVVTDIKMPVMDGVEALRVISREMTVPVVFVSGETLADDEVQVNMVHVLLAKPVDAGRLQEGIEQVMGAFREMFGMAPIVEP